MSITKRNNNIFPSSLFDDFFTRDMANWGWNNNSTTNTTIPAVNISETVDHYEVEMAAPGMKKDDFKIELDGNQLTITCEKESQTDQNNDQRYSRKEFSYQSFRRMFQLPKDVVDADKIEAK